MKPNFYRKILDNGMTVILEKRNVPVVSIAIAARTGAINETSSDKGISHFMEHMLYKGTKKRSAKQIAEEIELSGGDLNGFTDYLVTAYWCKLPSKHLKIGLDVLTDMIKNSIFDEKELEKERKVIFEEIKMRKDSPRTYVMDKIHSFLYKGDFAIPIIGTYESMNSITRGKMLERFKKIYNPSNLILAVVGDADFPELVDFAEKNFGKAREKISNPKVELQNQKKTEARKGIDQANLIFAYHVPVSEDKRSYAAYLLNLLMAGGMSSRLFSEIREKRNLAYAVKGDSEITKDFAYNLIYVGTTKDKIKEVEEIILQEFRKVAEKLTKKELDKIKEQAMGNYQISMEDSQLQLTNLLMEEINGNAEKFYDFEKNISAVGLEEVKKLAKIGNYSLFVLLPDSAPK